MNLLKRNKNTIGVLITTLLITSIIMYFNVYRFYGYKVSIGKENITFVKNKMEFNKAYEELQREIKLKYSKVVTVQDFTLDKVKVNNEGMFISGNELKRIMSKKFNIVVDGFLMESDNKKVAFVSSQNQGNEVLISLKNYYCSKLKLNSTEEISVENKISYEAVNVRIGSLNEKSKIVDEVVKYNSKSNTPLIAVKVVGDVIKNQVIYPTIIMKSSSELMRGISKVNREGKKGAKKVTTEVIAINNNILSEKFLKSEITTQVQDKEIYVGTNNPSILKFASINTPSRGGISSNFGMRWGKMHEGIDIAASFGSTISAVLDGTVTYAAWEEGYGNVIKIDHGGGIETTYGHCSVIIVKMGEVVKKGMKIGEVGSTGHSTGPHLHFEIRKNGEPINPQRYMK